MVRVMVFNATFNNISLISWWSVLLVEEPKFPGENHWSAASHWQTLSHNVVSSTPRPSGIWKFGSNWPGDFSEVGPSNEDFYPVWFQLAWWFQRRLKSTKLTYEGLGELNSLDLDNIQTYLCKWFLFNAKWTIFLLYLDENNLHLDNIRFVLHQFL